MDRDKLVELVLSECKILQDYINNDYFPKIVSQHNVKPEYNFIQAKQELVALRGYFPGTKKKYALNIINMEGVPVNEKEIKGLTTRRSDYSSFTRENISKIVDMLILNEVVEFSKIKDFIEEIRKILVDALSLRDLTLGRPVSFKQKLEDYKKIPSSILGMFMWNQLEYEYFTTGTKGYSFPILGIDENLLPIDKKKKLVGLTIPKCIVVPHEEPKIPDYYILDMTEILAFAWDNRVDEIIDPIKAFIFKNKKLEANTSLEW